MNQQALSEWLLKLNGEVQQTNQRFPKNLIRGWPIPFFGDILHARVLTVGVNPSDKAFSWLSLRNDLASLGQPVRTDRNVLA